MINKQSNVYTIVYITVMVLIVGTALAFTAMSLKDKQLENKNADKMGQILQSVHLPADRATVVADFNKYITKQIVLNDRGEEIEGQNAFDIDVAAEAKKPLSERMLPVYVCEVPQAGTKYIIPLAGMGLWGAIWGYISFDADGTTVYGAYFGHASETPGLGAEITKPAFTEQFDNLKVIKNDQFIPIEVVKKGLKPEGDADYVDGISGGTITSKGVSSMLHECLLPYKPFLERLAGGNTGTTEVPSTPEQEKTAETDASGDAQAEATNPQLQETL